MVWNLVAQISADVPFLQLVILSNLYTILELALLVVSDSVEKNIRS